MIRAFVRSVLSSYVMLSCNECHKPRLSASSHTIANTTTTPTIMAPAGAGRFVAIAPLPGVNVATVGAALLTTQFVAWGWPSLICEMAQTVVPPSLPTVVVMLTIVGVEAMVEVMEITVAGVPEGGDDGGVTTEVGVLLGESVVGVVGGVVGTMEDVVVGEIGGGDGGGVGIVVVGVCVDTFGVGVDGNTCADGETALWLLQ